MGAKTPAAGGEKKPFVKHEGKSNSQCGGRHNAISRDNTIMKDSFLGTNPDFCEHVFRTRRNQS